MSEVLPESVAMRMAVNVIAACHNRLRARLAGRAASIRRLMEENRSLIASDTDAMIAMTKQAIEQHGPSPSLEISLRSLEKRRRVLLEKYSQ